MPRRMKTVGKYAGYALGTALLTLYFMFLTFPYSTLVDRFLPLFQAAFPGKVSVGEVRATPLFWLKVSKLEVLEQGVPSSPLLEVDDLWLRPALLSLLTGRPAVSVKANLYDGAVRGKIGRKQDTLNLSLSWEHLQPGKHPFALKLGGGELKASLAGKLSLSVKGSSWESSEGSLNLALEGGPLKNLQVYGFTLPSVDEVTGKAAVKLGQRKAEVETLSLESSQVSASLGGKIDLLPRLAGSRLNLNGKLKLDGALASQYETMLAGFLRNKDAQGYYTFSLRGTLASPRFSL